MTANEWWHNYVKEYGITPGAIEAYNAGMERAAEIASNVKAPFSRFTIAAKIRNEIEND